MLPDSVANLVKALHQHRLLRPEQWKEVATQLAGTFGDPKSLARELLQRGWLTPYQINLLFNGRGQDLLLGSYVLLERVGEGGMGQVFKARQTKLDRIVALKVIRKERLSNPDAVRRFYREIESAARLNHPNVVVAFDADHVGDTHFFAMEYVEGIDLAKRVKQQGPLPLRDACDFIRQAALGLQHAFERGLIHRDIKPANLLVTHHTGVVKVLDMGLARPNLETEDSGVSTLTQEGTVMGTPDYIAPEQARDAHKADIRSDLYSLGCTLYFLISGRVPFPGGTLTEKLLKHQMDTPTPLADLRTDVPPVVVELVECLMAKKAEERLQTPAQLAEVLAQVVQGAENVPAGQVAARVGRPSWVPATPTPTPMPNPDHTPVQTVDPFADLVDTATGSDTPSKVKVGRETPAPVLRPVWTFFHKVHVLNDRVCGPLAQRLGLPRERAWVLPAAALGLVVLLIVLLSLPRKLPSGEGKGEDKGLPTPKKPWELPSPLDGLESSKIPPVEHFEWMPPELVAVAGEHRGRHAGGMNHLALSPDGKLIASAGKDTIHLWDADTLRLRSTFKAHTGLVHATAFTADGKGLISVGADMMVRCWSLEGPEPTEKSAVHAHTAAVKCLTLTPDGKTLITGGLDHLAIVWDVTDKGLEVRSAVDELDDAVRALAFSASAKVLAVSDGPKVRLYDLRGADPKLKATLTGPTGDVQALAFSDDGKTLAAGTKNAWLHVWDLLGESAQERGKPVAAKGQVLSLQFAGNTTLVCASEGAEVWAYNLAKAKLGAGRVLTQGKKMCCVVASSDGKRVVTGGQDTAIRSWNMVKAIEVVKTRLVGQPGPVPAIALAPSGLLATAGGAHSDEVQVWDLTAPEPALKNFLMPTLPGSVHALAFSRGGSYLAAGAGTGLAVVWDMSNLKKEPLALSGHIGNVLAVAFSPDGKLVATGDGSKVRLWDLRNPQNPQVLDGHSLPVLGLSFSPDGKRLASAGQDLTVRVWDLTMRPPTFRPLNGHTNQVTCVQFSVDGQMLVSGGLDSKVRSWDLADGKEFPDDRYAGHKAAVSSLAFSPDGHVLASADQKGLLYLRDLHADRKKSYQFPVAITALAYAADSRHLAVATANSAVYILRVVAPPRSYGS